jgi:hypothetical protein
MVSCCLLQSVSYAPPEPSHNLQLGRLSALCQLTVCSPSHPACRKLELLLSPCATMLHAYQARCTTDMETHVSRWQMSGVDPDIRCPLCHVVPCPCCRNCAYPVHHALARGTLAHWRHAQPCSDCGWYVELTDKQQPNIICTNGYVIQFAAMCLVCMHVHLGCLLQLSTLHNVAAG